MSEWVSVEDRLPPMKPYYKGGPRSWSGIGYTGSHVTAVYYEETFSKRIPRWKNFRGYSTAVTHWMDFPEPPREKQ